MYDKPQFEIPGLSASSQSAMWSRHAPLTLNSWT